MVWREWVGDGDMNAWNAAVLDVCWVTRRLCEMMYYSPTVKIIPTLKRYEFIEIFSAPSNCFMLLGPLMYKLPNLMLDAPRDRGPQLNAVFRLTMIFHSLYLEAPPSFPFVDAML